MTRIIKKLFAGAVVLGLCWWVFQRMPGMPVGAAFPLTLLIGLGLGLFMVKSFLPRVADTIIDLVYAGGGSATEGPSARGAHSGAQAMAARGDFQGAIEEYQRTLRTNPEDLHAIGEIAKIKALNLDEPDEAVTFLQSQLCERTWPQDAEAFILFRIASIQREARHDREAAREILNQVMNRFPKTRHSANARHKLEEWQREEAREEQIRRRKLSA